MTALALVLLLVAAFLHATWNYCVKRANGGPAFAYAVSLGICGLYLPVAAGVWWWTQPALSWMALAWIFGSGCIKASYFLFLQRAYRAGDFSLVYPVARGTGPLLSTLAAVLLLGERPSPLALGGAAAIIGAIFWLAGGLTLLRQPRAQLRQAVLFGVATGFFIAGLILWDRQGVATLAISPLLYDAGTSWMSLLLLTPLGVRCWPEVVRHWRVNRRYVVGAAVLSPIGYVLVLIAMTFTPLSYVAPIREVSIVIGAYLGTKVLQEADARRRITAAVAMAGGVVALALG
jgi:drug/metabolite transporter (DMT)-like permease